MYKISTFSQYKYTENKINFILWKTIFWVPLEKKEINCFISFFNNFLWKDFSEDDFFKHFEKIKRKKIFFDFLLKTNIIISVNNWYYKEVITWANINYNNWLLMPKISKEESAKLCINQHDKYSNIISDKDYNLETLKILKNRISHRNYNKNNIYSESEILDLFRCTYWNIRSVEYQNHLLTHKTTPSWWAFYPLKIYFLKFKWSKILIQKFNWIDFDNKWEINKSDFIKNCIVKDDNLDFDNAIWVTIILWDIFNIWQKYWWKAHSLILLEWWHISQNFVLASEELNIWTCELWWVYEEEIMNRINVDKTRNIFINTILFWRKND